MAKIRSGLRFCDSGSGPAGFPRVAADNRRIEGLTPFFTATRALDYSDNFIDDPDFLRPRDPRTTFSESPTSKSKHNVLALVDLQSRPDPLPIHNGMEL